jgi:hypothetical protein
MAILTTEQKAQVIDELLLLGWLPDLKIPSINVVRNASPGISDEDAQELLNLLFEEKLVRQEMRLGGKLNDGPIPESPSRWKRWDDAEN